MLGSSASSFCPYVRSSLALSAVTVLAVVSLNAMLSGWSSGGAILILAAGVSLAAAFVMAVPPAVRRDFAEIFVVALMVRVAAHAAVFSWAAASGGPFLSSDATLYYRGSLALVDAGFGTGVWPPANFGTFDCAHYYLFALARWAVDAGLYDLQTLNIVLSSLVGPFTFALAARLEIPRPSMIGFVVALYPTLIALAINDLQKDAAALGFLTMGVWAVVELVRGTDGSGRRLMLLVVAALALSYVRMSRFYVPAFFLLGLILAFCVALLRCRSSTPRYLPATVIAVVVLVETIPMAMGWPSSITMLQGAVRHSLGTPQMRLASTGLLDRMRDGAVSPRHRGDVAATGPRSTVVDIPSERVLAAPHDTAGAETRPSPQAPGVIGPSAGGEVRSDHIVVDAAASGVRKIFGPFPWILPTDWSARSILVGDYLMLPGTVVWYLVFPLAVFGLVALPGYVWRERPTQWPLLAIGVFVGLLASQYMVLNLSYRHREFMFHLLMVMAAFGFGRIGWSRRLVSGYGLYVVALVMLAILHVELRAP